MSLPTLSPNDKKMMSEQLGNLGNAVISSTNNNSNIPENNTTGNTSSNTNNSSISSQNKSESQEENQNDPDTKQIEIVGNDAKKMQDLVSKNENKDNNNNNNSNKSKKNLPKNNNLTKKNNNNKKGNLVNITNSNEAPVDEEPMANEPSVNENMSKSTEEDEEDKPDLENTTTNEITKDISEITGENTKNTTKKELIDSLNKLTMTLLNHQVVMKLFHFQTNLYGAHKASDSYGEKFAATMDKFLEIAQGIYGKITLKKFRLTGSSHTDENIVTHLDGIVILLRSKINDILGEYTELINVRDELVGDAEQLKYLLTFK